MNRLKIAMTGSLIFLCGTMFPLKAQSDEGHKLKVKVTNIKKGIGQMRIAAYSPEQKFLGSEITAGVSVEVNESGELVAIFENLPYGRYALSGYHDENSNGELDTNFMHIPNEPYGFSNNARGMFGPPKYSAAEFEFVEDGQIVEMKVK